MCIRDRVMDGVAAFALLLVVSDGVLAFALLVAVFADCVPDVFVVLFFSAAGAPPAATVVVLETVDETVEVWVSVVDNLVVEIWTTFEVDVARTTIVDVDVVVGTNLVDVTVIGLTGKYLEQ